MMTSAFRPHVVLLEPALVDMDVLELVSRLRFELVSRLGRQADIIAITKLGTRYHRRLSYEAGLTNHLMKPVDLETLCALLDTEFHKLAEPS